jgi:hypothetical protein
MGMDAAYQAWHQQADDLHFKVQDAFDEPEHQACQALKQQMRELINDCSQQRSPRDIEERIKGIIELLEPARNGSQAFMSVQDAVTYHDTFERLRREVREHPHYS